MKPLQEGSGGIHVAILDRNQYPTQFVCGKLNLHTMLDEKVYKDSNLIEYKDINHSKKVKVGKIYSNPLARVVLTL